MRTWFALIVTPSLALAVQSIMYALVTPECSTQTRIGIHAVAGVSFALALVLTALAAADWGVRSATLPGGPDSDHGDQRSARRFLSAVATGVAALSAIVILCMWMGAWLLSPCSDQ